MGRDMSKKYMLIIAIMAIMIGAGAYVALNQKLQPSQEKSQENPDPQRDSAAYYISPSGSDAS
jgi:flagellar basal body-associated protein FliL